MHEESGAARLRKLGKAAFAAHNLSLIIPANPEYNPLFQRQRAQYLYARTLTPGQLQTVQAPPEPMPAVSQTSTERLENIKRPPIVLLALWLFRRIRALLQPSSLLFNYRLVAALLLTGIAIGGSFAGYARISAKHKPSAPQPLAVATTKTPPPTVTKTPATSTPTPAVVTPAPSTKPTPVPIPVTATTPPPPPPSLPAVAGKNTSYNLGVLVIKYFPLTSNGQNIDINVTGDVGDPYVTVRQHTIDVTNNLLTFMPKATKYLGYAYGGDQPAINLHVVATIEHTTAVPINSTIHPGYVTYPDYYGIMQSHNICNYVDNQGVHEVWLWAYQGPNQPSKNNQPYLGIEESKMSGPFGDISNSYEWNDMPVCKHTYVVYSFNYGRGTAEAVHSWGHQLEAEFKAVNSSLFGLFQGPDYPQTLGVTGRCGWVHNPPNARQDYDYANTIPQASDCLDWNPNGMGAITNISCAEWGCTDISDSNNAQLNYLVWMWQNLPGMNNTKTYQGMQLRNWWDVHGEFDTVMGSSKRLTL